MSCDQTLEVYVLISEEMKKKLTKLGSYCAHFTHQKTNKQIQMNETAFRLFLLLWAFICCMETEESFLPQLNVI